MESIIRRDMATENWHEMKSFPNNKHKKILVILGKLYLLQDWVEVKLCCTHWIRVTTTQPLTINLKKMSVDYKICFLLYYLLLVDLSFQLSLLTYISRRINKNYSSNTFIFNFFPVKMLSIFYSFWNITSTIIYS